MPARVFVLRAPDRFFDLDLLLDTGARLSVLRRSVADRLGIDIDRDLHNATRDTAIGIGGSEELVRARVGVVLQDDEFGELTLRPVLRFAISDAQVGLPSLLGMDLLSAFDVRVAGVSDQVILRLPPPP